MRMRGRLAISAVAMVLLAVAAFAQKLERQWTPKIRPYVDTVDPANGRRVV